MRNPTLNDLPLRCFKKTPTVQECAKAFIKEMRATLEPSEMNDAIALNKQEPNKSVCHTHDFCDANMVMASALKGLCSKLPNGEDPESFKFWNAAWKLAFDANFDESKIN